MTTGEAGLRQQARGLGQAISDTVDEKLVKVGRLRALAPGALFAGDLRSVSCIDGGALEPPWPDVLISCGRRGAVAATAVRRYSQAPMVSVHIQRPSTPADFDLVVVMPHDRLQGPNVLCVDTALHGVRPAVLARAAQQGDPRFAGLPRPWTGVLLGGSTKRAAFSVVDAHRLTRQLDSLRASIGGALLITPSRRTPPEVLEAISTHYAEDSGVFVWDGAGPNPYLPILALADRIVVTSDSVSMISEALATTATVLVFKLAGGRRHTGFVRELMAKGLVADLGGDPGPPRSAGADATATVARRVLELAAARLGQSA